MPLQTSVEWLDSELWNLRLKLRGEEISLAFYCEQEVKLIEQAKAIEKEQMIDFANKVTTERLNESIYTPFNLEQYYTQTFNS
jgi:hypothetical protein